ncbi:Mor transcription activator family protein [Rhodocyclus tenuis]|uniref:Mor family transcriptional regulator n=1 Tax=Rhodocyclus tenuis TaxID=1066 RepID=A0A840G749_RHOTE|nr:Mor transcription activator family protein [Rhodocyclus tenuis]MBB4246528.1 Mor family transcriptional regulator [Rhodocyclus tenuis]
MSRGAPQLIADLAETIAAELVKSGQTEEIAVEIGVAVADKIRGDWGGEPIYIPKGCAIDISRRDVEIFEKFNGTNHHALAREYNLTVIHIYRVVKAVRLEMVKKRQGALF